MAEAVISGRRKLLGMGRLVTDANRKAGELALLVSDAWHGHGLGKLLTEYCLELARNWQLESVYAATTSDNRHMLHIFQTLGFRLDFDREPGCVLVSEVLGDAATKVSSVVSANQSRVL